VKPHQIKSHFFHSKHNSIESGGPKVPVQELVLNSAVEVKNPEG
jgi:hypothetical protein